MAELSKDFTGRTTSGRTYLDPQTAFMRADSPQPHIADPSGGLTSDTQARATIVAILDLLEAHGLMASS